MTHYAESFGYQWRKHPRTQWDPVENELVFREKTGLTPEDIRGKRVLDAGCGAGRFLEVISRWGAADAVGCDVSDAWKVAALNLSDRENVVVFNKDIFDLPKLFYFDVIYSIGVLHHTPDPVLAVKILTRSLKPGGLLAIWVYGRMGRWVNQATRIRRITTKLPFGLLHALCLLAIPWHHVRRIPVIGKYIWRLVPVSQNPDPQIRWLDTFDWYSPGIQNMYEKEEVIGWCLKAGLSIVTIPPFPVAVLARKPPEGPPSPARSASGKS